LTAFSRDGAFRTNRCFGATTRKLNEKASLYEGHGFSRAVNRLCMTAFSCDDASVPTAASGNNKKTQ
jgi:hypothetical protein